jgi:TMEM175 potassium channel family protein
MVKGSKMEQEDIRESKARGRREAAGVGRVNAFSDAVFAVAITLLILTIDVPQLSDAGQLGSALRALWPKFEGFLLSFVVIGAFWIAHHLIFGLIERSKPLLLWINLLLLMCIVALPFSTDLMSQYKGRISTIST